MPLLNMSGNCGLWLYIVCLQIASPFNINNCPLTAITEHDLRKLEKTKTEVTFHGLTATTNNLKTGK